MATSRREQRLSACATPILVALALTSVTPALAGPITIPSAIPLARDTFTARVQAIDRKRIDDRPAGREARIEGLATALGYGFSRDWTGIAIVPYLDKTLASETSDGSVRRQARGVGDTTLLARYQAWEVNEPGATFRVAPIAGVVAPTGATDERDALGKVPRPLQPGAGSWGGIAGAIMTRGTLTWQVDAALTWTTRGRHEGFEPGDEIELAGSYQYRLPGIGDSGPGPAAFLNAVLEAKGIHRDDDVVDGARVDNGGTAWRVAPGLQYVTHRLVAEAAVELPLADDLPDSALRDERFMHIGVRFNF
jgi:hypothetical protein